VAGDAVVAVGAAVVAGAVVGPVVVAGAVVAGAVVAGAALPAFVVSLARVNSTSSIQKSTGKSLLSTANCRLSTCSGVNGASVPHPHCCNCSQGMTYVSHSSLNITMRLWVSQQRSLQRPS